MKLILFTLIFLYSLISFTQSKEEIKHIEHLIEGQFTSINIIDSVFYKNRKNKNLLELLVKKSEENSYLEGIFYGSNALGRYYRDISLFDKALKEYQKALNITRKINDINSELKTLNQIGSVYRRQDDIMNALSYHKEALDKAIIIKPRYQY